MMIPSAAGLRPSLLHHRAQMQRSARYTCSLLVSTYQILGLIAERYKVLRVFSGPTAGLPRPELGLAFLVSCTTLKI